LKHLPPVELVTNFTILGLDGHQRGDTLKLVELVADIVRGEGFAANRLLPRSIQIGSDTYEVVTSELKKVLETLEEWKPAVTMTDCEA
jgi:hypothetical protein